MTERVIEVAGVEKAYRFFRLGSVSLELEAGQILGFVGPNGAGKSTLMRILMGMIRHDRGTVRVLGHPIPEEQASAKRDIGYSTRGSVAPIRMAGTRRTAAEQANRTAVASVRDSRSGATAT
jgi:ABC-type multidrug transport system ATPase subunit